MEDRSVELYQQREEAFFFGKKVRVGSENCFWCRGWVTGHLYKNKLYFFQDSEDFIKGYITSPDEWADFGETLTMEYEEED